MTAVAAVNQNAISIGRLNKDAPILFCAGREWIGIHAGTRVSVGSDDHTFDVDIPLSVGGTLVPGYDYGVRIDRSGRATVELLTAQAMATGEFFAGFHFAPSGNAEGKEGGDGVPAINPHSIWDIDFRPACPDPRGMARVELLGGASFWADIYLLAVDHTHGTSRCGAAIADGRSLPERPDEKAHYKKLDYATAAAIYTHHGKRLLGAEEFFAAAYGVKERCSRDDEPDTTGAMSDDAKRFVSRFGLFDATGTMWQWGTDGHPDEHRASIFGGSWISGGDAGSRYADLDYWAGSSGGSIGARGASDHLHPA